MHTFVAVEWERQIIWVNQGFDKNIESLQFFQAESFRIQTPVLEFLRTKRVIGSIALALVLLKMFMGTPKMLF